MLLFAYFWALTVSSNSASTTSAQHDGRTSATNCFLVCVARCVQSQDDQWTLEDCRTECLKYNFASACPSNATNCWRDFADTICPESDNKTEGVRHMPMDFNVTYVQDPYPQPYRVQLHWRPVQYAQLYAVQVKDMDDHFSQFGQNPADTILFFQTNRGQYRKPKLCPPYGFRVAAVNHLGASNYTEVVKLSPPDPDPVDPTYTVTDIRAIGVPFISNDEYQTNKTIAVTLGFDLPPNWNLEDLTTVETSVNWVNCVTKLSTVEHKKSLKFNESRITILLPDIDYSKKCTVLLRLDKLYSRCKTVYRYPTIIPDSDTPGRMINLDCDTVINSNCPQDQQVKPLCATESFAYEQHTVFNDSDIVNLNISWEIKSPRLPILYYAIHVFELQTKPPENNSVFFLPKTLRSVQHIRTCSVDGRGRLYDCENRTTNAVLNNLHLGRRYGVCICAVFTEDGELAIQWNITARQEIDLTQHGHHRLFGKPKQPNTMLIAVSCLLALGALFSLLFTAYRCTKRYDKEKKRKTLDQLARDGAFAGSAENPYVVQPKRYDHWEIGRGQLEIDLDNKLGAGAFGAVYKARLVGRLTAGKLSNSPVAENWTKAENSPVAVKMLPEYADDNAKADFRKEINLMKRLGYHEKLVNMLGCITIDEPLCLIVEYCTDGDLLHYLRDRRVYMVKLEQAGVDIKNPQDSANIDVSMLLCLKDLVSFAWQICVGLEFLSQKGFVHRDVAARNVLVDQGKRMKIGDFGLCRYVYSDSVYTGKGGRLPVKWMAPEAIKSYEFTNKSDVWSFGILLIEIITLGGTPYPGVQPSDIEQLLDEGKRMEQPVNCPDEMYKIMIDCWMYEPQQRPNFTGIRESLRVMLERITEDYNYTGLSQERDYYNVLNSEDEDGSSTEGICNEAYDDDAP